MANTSQHAERVLRILQVDDLVEGLVFCDYSEPNFTCKPETEFFHNVRPFIRPIVIRKLDMWFDRP